ncbi:hypothetical protein JCM15124A_21010 [Prevotella falsenii]
MGANTMAINHFKGFRMRMGNSQQLGRYILDCKCTKKKSANATVCEKKLGVGLCLRHGRVNQQVQNYYIFL